MRTPLGHHSASMQAIDLPLLLSKFPTAGPNSVAMRPYYKASLLAASTGILLLLTYYCYYHCSYQPTSYCQHATRRFEAEVEDPDYPGSLPAVSMGAEKV